MAAVAFFVTNVSLVQLAGIQAGTRRSVNERSNCHEQSPG